MSSVSIGGEEFLNNEPVSEQLYLVEPNISDAIVFSYLSKFIVHMHHVEIYKYYIALPAPELLEETLPKKKSMIFGVNIEKYNLKRNYSKFFKAFLGKICDKDMHFSYCNMLMSALSDYIIKDQLNCNIDYSEVVVSVKKQIKEIIIKVLMRISNRENSLSSLFLWQTNRKVLEKDKIANFSFKHPLYSVFSSIKSSEFIFDISKIDAVANRLLSGNAIVFYGYILIPEDFGIDTGIDEILFDKALLVKYVNRCFQELINHGYYDLFWIDKNITPIEKVFDKENEI